MLERTREREWKNWKKKKKTIPCLYAKRWLVKIVYLVLFTYNCNTAITYAVHIITTITIDSSSFHFHVEWYLLYETVRITQTHFALWILGEKKKKTKTTAKSYIDIYHVQRV